MENEVFLFVFYTLISCICCGIIPVEQSTYLSNGHHFSICSSVNLVLSRLDIHTTSIPDQHHILSALHFFTLIPSFEPPHHYHNDSTPNFTKSNLPALCPSPIPTNQTLTSPVFVILHPSPNESKTSTDSLTQNSNNIQRPLSSTSRIAASTRIP